MTRKRRIVVLGGTSAGPSAAAAAARRDPDAEVRLYEQGPDVSYGVCELPYYLAGEIEREETLVVHTPESLAREKRVEAFVGHRAEAILPAQRRVAVRDIARDALLEIEYDRLVLALGCRARTHPAFPADAENVFALKSLDDGRRLRGAIEAGARRACVVGAGYVGIETAEALLARGIDVDMVFPDELPMPYYDPEARAVLRDLLTEQGVRLHPGRTPAGVRTTASRVTAVRTDAGEIETDVVVVAIGLLPNVEIAREAGLRTGGDGAILTDQRMATNVDGLFACGDCIEIFNPTLRRTQMMPFAGVASRTGRVAGENAAGGSAAFRGSVPLAALAVFEHEFAQVGSDTRTLERHGLRPVRASVVAGSRVGFMPGNVPLLVSLTADARTRRLLGGMLIGREHAAQRANVVALAVREELTVDRFLDADFLYTPRLAPLRDPLAVCARQLARRLGSSATS